MARFSKEPITDVLRRKIQVLEDLYDFEIDKGSIQLRGKGNHSHINYGRYTAYCDLLEDLCD